MPQETVHAVGRHSTSLTEEGKGISEEGYMNGDDIGVTALTGAVTEIDPNGPEARRVLKKIDLHLMPLLMITYMIQKINIARVCGIFIILWGVVLLCMTAANDFAGLATARFFLGAMEWGVSPCFVLMTTMFYNRSEQPFRTGIWFSMNGLAQIFGGLIAYGIGYINTTVPSWKFPFIIFGAATIIWGVVFTLLAPSNPTQARWLSAEEKEIAILRLIENETGIDNKTIKWYQVQEAFVDPRFWLINLYILVNCIPNGAISAFGPLIINGFGFTKFQATLLGMPTGVTQVMALWIAGYIVTKLNGCRHFLMIGGILIATLGSSLIYALSDEQRIGRLL
ncbi:transporter [Seiridium cupressi]